MMRSVLLSAPTRFVAPDASRQRLGAGPDAFEAFEVGGDHVAAVGTAEVEQRSARVQDAVGVLADEELVVGAEDAVVKDSPVQPDLHAALVA